MERRLLMSPTACACGRSGPFKRGMCATCYARWRRHTPAELRPRASVQERFDRKVTKGASDECWLWTGSNKDGYGEFHVSVERGRVPAHTFAVELATGEECPPNKEGCHKCDNPPCVNPSHVYYGTRKQNVADMYARERVAVGSGRHNAVLTEDDVVAIRTRWAAGESGPSIRVDYGITSGHLSNIVNGKEWKRAGGPIGRRNEIEEAS